LALEVSDGRERDAASLEATGEAGCMDKNDMTISFSALALGKQWDMRRHWRNEMYSS
jgi:hypothetical protein